jgi:hypothetical protein
MDLRGTAPQADIARIATEGAVDETFYPDLPLLVVGYEGDEPVGLANGIIVRDDPAEPLPYVLVVNIRLRPAWAGPRRALALIQGLDQQAVRLGVPRFRCRVRKTAPLARRSRGFARLWGLTLRRETATHEVWGRDGLTGEAPAETRKWTGEGVTAHV